MAGAVGRIFSDDESAVEDLSSVAGIDTLRHERSDISTRRLWRPLSYRPRHPREIKDLDVVGERVLGIVARLSRSRRRIRAAAESVVRASDALRSLSESALDDEINNARETARRGDRSFAARQHAFAVVREVVRRERGLALYVEQIMGGWVMEDGCIAEMLTGEGKTITACLTAAVQGWMGYGVHVVTVNDYLARRDAELNTPVFGRLGLTVGVIQHESKNPERRAAYAKDVTYTSDQQLLFDHLRDRLAAPLGARVSNLILEELADTDLNTRRRAWPEQVVHRGLYAAIIDEADSVLIDQATTPAIIGAGDDKEDPGAEYYRTAAEVASELRANVDYEVDLQQHHVELTPMGKQRLEAAASRLPPFWRGPKRREELITQAVEARVLYQRDDHYVVKEDDVQIVDLHTGRVLEGRQWQLGLHQAIQAKEGLKISAARETLARMSYQRFFQQYRRLMGMTGTAWEVRHELWRWYRLPVVRIPPHKPMIRTRAGDRVSRTRTEKFNAVVARVEQIHRHGQPVLLGTRSVDDSEQLHILLEQRGLPHTLLNAVRDEEEAAVVAQAGRHGAITISTNMAGRGTDIILDGQAARVGGLVVVSTERHESPRIDRQLYGRAGRQGDPGRAETFVSLEDSLLEVAGFRPLIHLLRRWPMLLHLGGRRLLWWHAQHSASARQAASREITARCDLWLDRALYYESR